MGELIEWLEEFVGAGLLWLSVVLVAYALVFWVIVGDFEAAIFWLLLAVWAKL